MPRKLGTFEFPYDSPRGEWSGIVRKKSRADVQTLAGNATINWGFVLGDEPVVEHWPLMDESFYHQLEALHLADNGADTYIYEVSPTERYEVEIVELTGTPFLLGEDGTRYYRDVRLTLKILRQV